LLVTIPMIKKKTIITPKTYRLRSFINTHQSKIAKILPHVPGANGKYPTLKQVAIHSDIFNRNRG